MWLYDGEAGPLTELKNFIRSPRPASALKMMKSSGQLAEGLWAIARTGLIYKPGAAARLSLMCEQEPSRDSYIALADAKDRFGARKARLHWRVGNSTWATMCRFTETIGEEMQRLGLGHVRLDEGLRAGTPDWENRLSDVNHHMGGARMSASPADGVVNDQLRLWGVPNLHVCSAAVFPTGGHSNPTLTLLALAARLAEKMSTGG